MRQLQHFFINRQSVQIKKCLAQKRAHGTYDCPYRSCNRSRHAFRKGHRKAIIGINMHDTIVILKADKGNTAVVMDKLIYEEKISNILNDKAKYMLLNSARVPFQVPL